MMIKLKSSDDQTFEVEEDVASVSQTIKGLIDEKCAGNVIPLFNVTGDILEKVIDYMEKYAVDDSDKNKSGDDQDLEAFDKEFIAGVDKDTLFGLMHAANYLDIKKLLDLTCQAVADMNKGMKTPEEIREAFGIENDFTQEEEEAVRMETAWAFQ